MLRPWALLSSRAEAVEPAAGEVCTGVEST